jgi:hypothetical protein
MVSSNLKSQISYLKLDNGKGDYSSGAAQEVWFGGANCADCLPRRPFGIVARRKKHF